MAKTKVQLAISDEIITGKIFIIRGLRVMIDSDLADLYDVSTKRLNEQVKRNSKRFPEDFMFQLNEKEKLDLLVQHPHLNKLKYSPTLPFAFTEHGAVMAASVLNSHRAIQVNVQIVRIFTQIRQMLLAHKDILLNLEKLERKVVQHDSDIKLVFRYLRELLNPAPSPSRKIGFVQKTGSEMSNPRRLIT